MATQRTLPRVFIGSSSDGLEVANHLKLALEPYFEAGVWNQRVFPLSKTTLEGLVRASEEFDLAVLVVTPADMLEKEGATLPVARDNVIFEIGFFMGSLGRHRTFVVRCRDDRINLPSDLDGFTYAYYEQCADEDMRLVALQIRNEFEKGTDERITASQASERPVSFGKAVFSTMDLSEDDRKKLEQSEFIKIDGTRNALMGLIDSATKDHSLLAICGYKGDYSTKYYEDNFKNCGKVRRIFSYEAICDEIRARKKSHALSGLRMHLDYTREPGGKCDVEVFLIPEKQRIKTLWRDSFDPPSSFGLAILQDAQRSFKKAIVHWEPEAKPLKHLIDIEGVIIDDGQEGLLEKLADLYESIVTSNEILSSKRHPQQIEDLYNKLEEWKSEYLAGERGGK